MEGVEDGRKAYPLRFRPSIHYALGQALADGVEERLGAGAVDAEIPVADAGGAAEVEHAAEGVAGDDEAEVVAEGAGREHGVEAEAVLLDVGGAAGDEAVVGPDGLGGGLVDLRCRAAVRAAGAEAVGYVRARREGVVRRRAVGPGPHRAAGD